MTRSKKKNEYFEGIKTGLEEAMAWAKGEKVQVTVREVELPDPPTPMTARQIATLRIRKARASQAVFARLINASVHTVHAWEQGRGKPSGPALRFLRLLDKHPELIKKLEHAA